MKFRILSLPFLAALLSLPAAADEGHAHSAPAAGAGQSVCVVSGDKLGGMGQPVRYTYKQAGKPDRVVEFCCEDCIKDFEKDPAKYLAKLDAAAGKASGTAAKAEACCELVDKYVPVADALAADDLAKAKTAATALAKQAEADGMTGIAAPAKAIAEAKDIAAARIALKTLSAEVTPMADSAAGYVVMTCPMAAADWIQTDEKVRNPYYGKSMLTCGMPKAAK